MHTLSLSPRSPPLSVSVFLPFLSLSPVSLPLSLSSLGREFACLIHLLTIFELA